MSDSLELIGRFFDEELSEEELVQFRRRLEEEPEFAQAFAEASRLEEDLMEGIEMLGHEGLREELGEIYREEIEGIGKSSGVSDVSNEEAAPEAKVRSLSRRWWLMAAALAMLVIATPVVYDIINLTPAELYADNFRPDFDYTVKSGGGDELAGQAKDLLKAGKYEAALPLMDSLIKQRPDDGLHLLDKGIALVEIGAYEEGIAIFNSLRNRPLFKADAIWYEALSYLKQEKIDECRSRLLLIANNSVKAQKLLVDLGKLE